MKHLLIVRHAKSDWNDATLRDIDRPLNQRGERDAPEMGARLKKRSLVPQQLIASPARRALRTAQLLAAQFDYARADIEIVDALYEAGTGDWLALIGGLPESLGCVLVVGHNPSITELASLLCPAARIDDVPTCGVLHLGYGNTPWRCVAKASPLEWDFDFPKR